MSTEERAVWASAISTLIVPAFYFTRVLREARDTPVAEIDYQGSLIWTVGITIGVTIALTILLTIANAIGVHVSAEVAAAKSGRPADSDEIERAMKSLDRRDTRDKDISRRGEVVTGIVLGIGAVAPLVLAMTEREQFWIAQSLYAAFVFAALAGAITKIIVYRRGF